MSPIQIAILIIAVVTIVGVVVSFMRKSSALQGYDEIKAEVPKIAQALRAEMFRDGEDLVLAGNFKGRPAQVRFSYAENTPGLNIRMQAPVSFTFSSVPKGARATEGRVLMRTGSDMFDAKFASRTDQPTQAKMLVGSRAALQNIEKLCCSQKTYFTMSRGSIELSELVIPAPYTARHVTDHLESMAVIAKTVEDIPGAESVKIVPYEREKSAPIVRIALVVGAIAAVLGVFFIKPTSTQADLKTGSGNRVVSAEGVSPVDAANIGGLKGWHAQRPEEYDSDVAGSLRAIGIEPNGRLTVDLDGDEVKDVIYTLVADDSPEKRLVVMQNNNVIYQTRYNNLAGVLPLPKDSISGIQWQVRPRATPDADGILVLTNSETGLQPTVLMFSGRQTISGMPKDWQSIPLQ